MKVKTRFSVLAALAACGLALVGCNNTNPTPVKKFHVSCSEDAAKYTVNGLQEKYAVGKNVTFTITENDAENWKVTGVTSAQAEVSTVGTLSYAFTMPEADVSLVVGVKEVDKYSVTASSDDIIVDTEITFFLSLGASEVINVGIEPTATETKSCEIHGNKVTFAEDGEYHLAFTDGDRSKLAIADYVVSVRAPEEGETEDNPITAARAVELGHELTLSSAKPSSPEVSEALSRYYWIQGAVTKFDEEFNPEYTNLSVTLEGGLSLYRIGCKSPLDPSIVRVGSVLTLYGQFYNYGTGSTTQANGKVQIYADNAQNPKSQIRKIDNSGIKSDITLDKTSLSFIAGESEVLTASIDPDNAATLSWHVDSESVATITPAEGRALSCTVAAAGIGDTWVYAYDGDNLSTKCHVVVGETRQVLRPLSNTEILSHQNMVLAYEDGEELHFSAGDPVSDTVYYMPTVTAEDGAAKATVTVEDGKYILKVGDYYIGYEYSNGTDGKPHHNLRTLTSIDDPLVAKLTLDVETMSFSLVGDDDAHTTVYFGKHSSQQTMRWLEAKSNSLVHFYGWAGEADIGSVELEDAEVFVGDTVTLKLHVRPFFAKVTSIVYTSHNTEFATVDSATGVVTGVAVGVATIGVVLNGTTSESCSVNVRDSSEHSSVEMAASEMTFTSTASPGAAVSFTKGGVTLALSAAWKGTYSGTVQARCGKNSTVTFSGKTITKIEFVCSGDASGTDYGPKNFSITSGDGEIAVTGDSTQRTGTWTGSTTELVLKCTASVRLISVVVTFSN